MHLTEEDKIHHLEMKRKALQYYEKVMDNCLPQTIESMKFAESIFQIGSQMTLNFDSRIIPFKNEVSLG